VGVLAAFGMAARRWYLLIPLMAASGGVAWLAYTQMPASYTATAVYQVSTSTSIASEANSAGRSRGLTIASSRTPPAPLAVAKSAAVDLVESVHPQPPAGSVPGRSTAQPVTIQLQQGTPVITVRAVADSVDHARDAVTATTAQLTDRLHRIADEQRALADSELTLDAVSPVAYQPPVRSVGRKVAAVTLLFCLGMSVFLAAAVERSARGRRLLAAQAARAEEDARDEDARIPVEEPAVRSGGDRVAEPIARSGGDRAAGPIARSGGDRAAGPVRTVSSARPAAPVRDDAAEDVTAVIFPAPPAERSPIPHRAPEPQRPLAAEAPPPPPRIPPPPARPGRPFQQGGRAPMRPRTPRDTEIPVPAALATGGNRRPPVGPMPPGPPRRPDPRPEPSMREARSPDPQRPGDRRDPERPGDRRDPAFDRPANPFAGPPAPFGGSNLGGPDLGSADLGSPDAPSSELGVSDLGVSDLGVSDLGVSDRDPLGSGSLDSGSLVPDSLDSVSLEPGSASTSFDSSALWLPVADLPAETDGWMPSLAPDEEVPGSGQEIDIGSDALLGEPPDGPYRDDFPPMLDREDPESTNVMPVHVGPETPEIGGPEARDHTRTIAESDDLGPGSGEELDLDGSSLGEGVDGSNADGSNADGSNADGSERDGSDRPAATPVADVPLDEPLVDEPLPGGSPAAAASETGERGPDHPDVERPASAAPSTRASSSSDEHGDLEGWPDFDEQVRV
jgi:hypothetical protein